MSHASGSDWETASEDASANPTFVSLNPHAIADGCGSRDPNGNVSRALFQAANNDVVVKASDGKTFGYRALWLEAASKPCESLVAAARTAAAARAAASTKSSTKSPAKSPSKRKQAGREASSVVIPLAAESAVVKLVLLYLSSAVEHPFLAVEELAPLADICFQLQLPQVISAALACSGPYLFPFEVLGCALGFKLTAVASAALRKLDEYETDPTGQCPLSRVPFKILERIPRTIFLRVISHYVADGGWINVIQELERCPHFWPDDDQAVRQLERLDDVMRFCRGERISCSFFDVVDPAPADPAAKAALSLDAGNVVIRANDGREFGFSKATLIAASPVLADKIAGAAPPKKKGGRISIKLNAPNSAVERLLLFLHPTVADPKLTEFDELHSLVELADLLELSQVARAALSASPPPFYRENAPELLALGILHDLPEVVAHALRAFDHPRVNEHDCDHPMAPSSARFTMADMPLMLMRRLDFAVLIRLHRDELRILSSYHAHTTYALLADTILEEDKSYYAPAAAEAWLLDDDALLTRRRNERTEAMIKERNTRRQQTLGQAAISFHPLVI